MRPSVLIVAGELSGDHHASALARALRDDGVDMDLWGVGGDGLRAEGARLLFDVRQTAVMGFVEVVRHLGFFRRMWRDLLKEVDRHRPDLAILVDYPGFNLRLAAALKRRGIRVLYYICPQVWAWHRSRMADMARDVDRLISIFPFEAAEFRGTGLRVDFVGHPFVDEIERDGGGRNDVPWPAGAPRIALLPGSRRQEIRRIFPVMLGAAETIRRTHPDASFVVAAANETAAGLVRPRLTGAAFAVVTERAREVLRSADAAWVASGTATVEAALIGCPQVVVYRAHPVSYWLGRALIRVSHIGMVNLIAASRLCPELIQGDATPARLAAAIAPLTADTPERRAMLEGYRQVQERLGPPGAIRRAAEIARAELASVSA